MTQRRQLSLTELRRERERVRERFSSSAGLLLRSEFTEFRDRQHNTCVGDKSIVFLHLPRKFRAGHLGLLSINFDLTLTLIYSANSSFLRVGEVQMRIYERSFQALLPSAPRGFAARSRVLSHKTKWGACSPVMKSVSCVQRENFVFRVKEVYCQILQPVKNSFV